MKLLNIYIKYTEKIRIRMLAQIKKNQQRGYGISVHLPLFVGPIVRVANEMK